MYANALGDLNTLKRARNARLEMVESSVAKAVLVICLVTNSESSPEELMILNIFYHSLDLFCDNLQQLDNLNSYPVAQHCITLSFCMKFILYIVLY